MAGQPIELVGFVLSRPQADRGALPDFWQADDKGRYDNSGSACAAINSPMRKGV